MAVSDSLFRRATSLVRSSIRATPGVGATFSSLGLTPGTYIWTWGSGADADSFTMNIGVSSVPEPASLMMLGTGSLAILGFARRRRRASA